MLNESGKLLLFILRIKKLSPNNSSSYFGGHFGSVFRELEDLKMKMRAVRLSKALSSHSTFIIMVGYTVSQIVRLELTFVSFSKAWIGRYCLTTTPPATATSIIQTSVFLINQT